MNWAFELLGLAPDTDAASVKRAYARLLRTTRPDEDAEAFQRLHAAYKLVLAQVSTQPAKTQPSLMPVAQERRADDTASSKQTPPAQAPPETATVRHTETVDVPAPIIHVGALADEIVHAAMLAEHGKALSRWLQDRPEFWSIQAKQQTGHLVLQRLFQQPRAMSSECLDALLRFFDLDHVLSGINPIAIQSLRIRQRTLWELQPDHHRELARRIGMMWGSQPDVRALGQDIRLLQRPRSWPRLLAVAFRFGRVRQLDRLVRTLLGNGDFSTLPPSIDRGHAYFWHRAAVSGLRMTRERFSIGILRATVVALLLGLSVLGLVLMHSMGSPPTPAEWADAISVSASIAIVVFALWPLFACLAWFDQWQGQPESAASQLPWLRRLAIPALCAVGLLLYELGMPGMAWLIALSFVFAVRKFHHRTLATSALSLRLKNAVPLLAWFGGIIASAVWHISGKPSVPFTPITALATFGVCFADLWRYRAVLHPRLVRR